MLNLNSEIEIEKINPQTLRVLDKRTGFQIEIEDECLPGESYFSDEIQTFFKEVGFIGANEPVSRVREKQLPYRRHLQAETRIDDFARMYEFAQNEVPFYQQNEPYSPMISMDDVSAFSNLPIITKDDIRSNFERLLANNAGIANGLKNKQYRIAQTSGTTGERLQVLSDMTLSRVPPNYKELWKLSIKDSLPKTAVLTTPTCSGAECHLGKATMAQRTRDDALLFLNSSNDLFNISDDEVRNVFEELNEFEPHFILCNPVYLHWVSRKAEALNLSFPSVELIWSSYQYLSIIQKKEIERLFQAPVYNSYTATELSGCDLTSECRFGHWHVREDQSFVEIEPLSGRTGIGNILVTNHASRLMPLIRYRIGDLAELTDVDCHCELSDWQTIEYHGRAKDRLFIDDSWITTKEFDSVIATQYEVDFYACKQARDGSVRLNIIIKPGAQLDKKKLRDKLNRVFKFKSLQIEQVQWLKPEASLKFSLTGSEMIPTEARSDA